MFSFGFESELVNKAVWRYWIDHLSAEEKKRLEEEYGQLIHAWNALYQPKFNEMIRQPPWGSEVALEKAGHEKAVKWFVERLGL